MDKDLLVYFVEQGFSTRQLSLEFDKGQSTIRYWLQKYNLKTNNKSFSDGYINPNIKRVEIGNQSCCGCGVLLTSNNSYDRKQRKTYSSYCKECHSKNTLEKRIKFKKDCVEYKGGSCINCGYDKNITALEFHHINPKEKEMQPSKMMGKSKEFIKNELDKCVLFCSNCHREEHYRINQRNALEKKFNNLTEVSLFSDFIMIGENTKLESCKMCDKVLTEENRGSGSHKHMCNSCDSKYVIGKAKKGKQRAVEYMGGCCSVCGYDNCIAALEFHHIDPTKKSKTYERRFGTWSFERQKEELKNCIIVCSNCHREIHSKDEWNT